MPGFQVQEIGAQPSRAADGTLISSAPSTFTPHYSYTWDLQQVRNSRGGKLNTGLIYAHTATLPSVTVEKEIIRGGSLNYKYASNVSFDPVSIDFYDVAGTVAELEAWRALVWSPESGMGYAFGTPPGGPRQVRNFNPNGFTGYKQTTILKSYTYDLSEANIYELVNSWPAVVRYGNLTYTKSEARSVQVVVEYDWAVITGPQFV